MSVIQPSSVMPIEISMEKRGRKTYPRCNGSCVSLAFHEPFETCPSPFPGFASVSFTASDFHRCLHWRIFKAQKWMVLKTQWELFENCFPIFIRTISEVCKHLKSWPGAPVSQRGPPSHQKALGLAPSTGKAWTCETEVNRIWLNIWSSSESREALRDGRLWYWPRTIAISYEMENLKSLLHSRLFIGFGYCFHQFPFPTPSLQKQLLPPQQTDTSPGTHCTRSCSRTAPGWARNVPPCIHPAPCCHCHKAFKAGSPGNG